jgi:hypothetical protein
MESLQMIRLGYEVRTGRAVDIPLDHTAVTGRTQQSGKTTTLEALVHRSKCRAVVFVTKKSESGFRMAHLIPPFFIDSADWEFVLTVLESTANQKLRFEQSWIMDACKGASTLEEVQENVHTALHGVPNPDYGTKKKGKKRDDRQWLTKPASGLNYGVLNVLSAFLQKVVPQIRSLPYTKTLKLSTGINVMDLSEYTTELQALVIRSVLEWVYKHERNTIVIIPEARDFIPQDRRSPVLMAAEQLIRKGGASKNFVWLDAQDIATMHKNVLRSVGVWIMGVQSEANEIKRMLNHIPAPKPSATDVMQLGLGQFFVRFQDKVLGSVMRKTYVQPFWIGDEHAKAIAMGEEKAASVEKIWSETEHEIAPQTPENPATATSQYQYPVKNFRETLPSTSEVIVRGEMPKIFPNAAEDSRDEHENWPADLYPAQPGDAKFLVEVMNGYKPAESEDAVWKEKFEALQLERDALARACTLPHLCQDGHPLIAWAGDNETCPVCRVIRGESLEQPDKRRQVPQFASVGTPVSRECEMERLGSDPCAPDQKVQIVDLSNGAYEMFKARLLKDAQVIRVLDARPNMILRVDRPTLDTSTKNLHGLISHLIVKGFFSKVPRRNADVTAEVKRYGGDAHAARVSNALGKLTEQGFLTLEPDGYKINPEAQIEIREAK